MDTKHVDGVVMWHHDTRGQRVALGRNAAARMVRRVFKPGTSVRASVGGPDMPVGVVQYTVPALTALGGVVVVLWPNGRVGRHTADSLLILK